MGRAARGWVAAVLVLSGCVPELRIVHRDASAEATEAALDAVTDDAVRDAAGEGIATDAPTDAAEAGDFADAGDVAEAGHATDAPVDGAVGDVTEDRADAGAVADASCTTGQTACGTACVDLARDARNCGRCGGACAVTGAEATCAAGVCGYATCSPGYSDCDGVTTNGCEVDVRSAADNCGSCGNACRYANATPRCTGGSCAIAACAMGYGNCDGMATNGCETDVRTTNAHCGACGHACLSGQSCAAGVCVEVQRSCPSAIALGCGLVTVPGGTFTLGGERYGIDSQRGTRVSAFLIDRYEVTVARFRAFWESGHSAPAAAVRYPGGLDLPFVGTVETDAQLRSDPACNWIYSDRERHPINCVNWPTAQAFCVWDGGRLPTQAEWEFAGAGSDGREVPWRATAAPAVALTEPELLRNACLSGLEASTARRTSCPVGSFPSGDSPFGVSDLLGGVAEWNADWSADYTGTGSGCWPGPGRSDPLCLILPPFNERIERGESWDSAGKQIFLARIQQILPRVPSEIVSSMGFRCARSRE